MLDVLGAVGHRLTRHCYRDEAGNPDTVRLTFGCIAATFFMLVLFQDVLGVMRF